MLDDNITGPALPVPPDELMAQWWSEDVPVEPRWSRHMARRGAAWGWEQAIPEREELAGIIDGLLQFVFEFITHGDVIPVDEPGEETFCEFLARARAAAERLTTQTQENTNE